MEAEIVERDHWGEVDRSPFLPFFTNTCGAPSPRAKLTITWANFASHATQGEESPHTSSTCDLALKHQCRPSFSAPCYPNKQSTQPSPTLPGPVHCDPVAALIHAGDGDTESRRICAIE